MTRPEPHPQDVRTPSPSLVLRAEYVPPGSHAEAPAPRLILVGGAFGRELSLDEAMRVGPHGGISVLQLQEETRASQPPPLSTM